ncbi:LytTR family DNA-binding domain-containing protein [Amylibacter sp. SFDW26]|uniref:LytTR family DNA-binding domain-containing protein n=1 Tax=Amylibacter sp. SFDW26 TaxID=2652722 RepID=UPI00186A2F64|nr:LytTR family DNA-binding domain-containing protein [Amylibacter sp. SFDW26]
MMIIFKEVVHKLTSRITLTAWGAASVICTLTGPFGTYNLDAFSHRLFFWGCLLFAGIAFCLLCLHTMFNVFPNLRPIYSKLIAISFFTVTYTNAIYFVVDMIYLSYTTPSILLVYAVVGSIAFSISAAIYWLHIRPNELRKKAQETYRNPPIAKSKPKVSPKLSNAVLSKFETDTHIIRLNMRDHYVEVFSDKGAKYIHMRFADAVGALSSLNGMQVHRSHWVNLDNVQDVIKSKGKISFKMSDGAEVPISRTKQKELKEMGLL